MDGASFRFILFGLAVALISNFSNSCRWRSAVLLVASIAFIGMLDHDVLGLLPLATFLAFGFIALKLLEAGTLKSAAIPVIVILLTYVWLKKYIFVPSDTYLTFPYLTLGLSYIFFRVLHVLIESGADRESPKIGLQGYLQYTLYFATFISGPIQRYKDFRKDQLAASPIHLDAMIVGAQLERIIRGFFKVNVLAMLLTVAQSDALAALSEPLGTTAKLAAALRLAAVYPFLLYANFSGYIDIVIGLARLMRIELPENFERPFSAASFIDFWNRWHITLSSWLKNYVYNPLLVNLLRRVSSPPLQQLCGVLCFFVTFFLVGIWHGRTSEFVFFGILQGGGVGINKLWQITLTSRLGRKRYSALSKRPPYVAFARGLTFTWFALTLFWFWGSWNQIDSIAGALESATWVEVWLALWIGASVVLAGWERLRAGLLSVRRSGQPVLTSRYAMAVYASALGLGSIVFTAMLNQPAPAIIYKAF